MPDSYRGWELRLPMDGHSNTPPEIWDLLGIWILSFGISKKGLRHLPQALDVILAEGQGFEP